MSRFFTVAILLAAALPAQLVADADLPRSAHRNAWPDRSHVVTLEVAKDGTAQWNGQAVTFAQLPMRLRDHVDRDVQLRLDATLPAAVLGELLLVMQGRNVGMTRIWLAVHGGAVLRFHQPRKIKATARLYASFDTRPTPSDLDERLRNDAGAADALLLLHAPAELRYQQLIDMLQRPLAAGFEQVSVTVWRGPYEKIRFRRDPRFAQLIDSHPVRPGHPSLSVDIPIRPKLAETPRAGTRMLLYGIGSRAALDPATQKLVRRALAWLADQQNEDGSWSGANRLHSTALATMAFVAEGSNMRSGPYKKNLKRAANYLRSQQDKGPAELPPAADLRTCALFAVAMTELQIASNYKLLLSSAYGALIDVEGRLRQRRANHDDAALAFAAMACRAAERHRLELVDDVVATIAREATRASAPRDSAVLVARLLRGRSELGPRRDDEVLAPKAVSRRDPFAYVLAAHAAAIAGHPQWRRWLELASPEIRQQQTADGALPHDGLDPVLATTAACLGLLARHRLGH